MKYRHVISGTLCWLLALTAGYLVTRAELDEQSSSLTELSEGMHDWITGARQTSVASSEIPLYIALDDPIFVAAEDGQFVQVGYVSDVNGSRARDPIESREVKVLIYESAVRRFPDGFRLEYYTTPMNLDWVVRMMIPPERQQEIRQLIQAEWEQHQQDVIIQLQPVFRGHGGCGS